MNTIFLSENEKEKMAYYVTSIDEATKDALINAKQIKHPKEQDKAFEELSIKLGLPCRGILKLGETSEISTSSLSANVSFFLGKDTTGLGYVGRNREVHYRDYGVTEEHQKRLAWIVNRCQDTTTSVKSIVKKMNGKYTILWEIPIDSDKHLTLKEKFIKEVVWNIND